MDSCSDEGIAHVGLGSGLRNELDVNFRIEIRNNPLLFP